jgi:hypothetical protein
MSHLGEVGEEIRNSVRHRTAMTRGATPLILALGVGRARSGAQVMDAVSEEMHAAPSLCHLGHRMR